MKTRLGWICVVLIAWLPIIIAAWDNTLPADNTYWNIAAGQIRDNWDHLETQFGVGITGNLQTDIVELTNAQIKDLADTPVELVAAQGSGTLIEFVSAILILDYGSDGLTESSDNLVIEYDNGTGCAVSEAIEMTSFIDAEVDTLTRTIPVKDAMDNTSYVVNKNLALLNSGNDFGGNASNDTTMTVIISYRVHTSLGL